MKNILITAALGILTIAANAQDIHFARTQDMQKWYNASLRNENDERTVAFNFRNVTYKQLVAFKSVSALADIPLVSSAARQSEDRKAYFGITGGFAVDKSNQGILRNSTAMLGMAYHLPLDVQRSTFISMGIQGSSFESRVNMDNVTTPDQFDKFGMIPGASPNDPTTSGKVQYFSLNAGLSVSHTDIKRSWYAGASARQLNKPQANLKGNTEYRMPINAGVQAGYQKTSGNDALGLDVMLNFKAKAYEHIGTLHYMHTFDAEDFDGAIGASIGYRYQDAIIPGINFKINKTLIGFNYDMIAGKKKSEINRVSFELGLKQIF